MFRRSMRFGCFVASGVSFCLRRGRWRLPLPTSSSIIFNIRFIIIIITIIIIIRSNFCLQHSTTPSAGHANPDVATTSVAASVTPTVAEEVHWRGESEWQWRYSAWDSGESWDRVATVAEHQVCTWRRRWWQCQRQLRRCQLATQRSSSCAWTSPIAGTCRMKRPSILTAREVTAVPIRGAAAALEPRGLSTDTEACQAAAPADGHSGMQRGRRPDTAAVPKAAAVAAVASESPLPTAYTGFLTLCVQACRPHSYIRFHDRLDTATE